VMAAAPSGDCNRCHSGNPDDGPGRIHLP